MITKSTLYKIDATCDIGGVTFQYLHCTFPLIEVLRLGKPAKFQTWMKRKGLATKLLGNPAPATSAHVTTGFDTGHAAPPPLEIPHCGHRNQVKQQHHKGTRRGRRGFTGGAGYVLDWLEGEGGVPEEYAGGPGTLGVGAAQAGGRRVREAREGGVGVGERC